MLQPDFDRQLGNGVGRLRRQLDNLVNRKLRRQRNRPWRDHRRLRHHWSGHQRRARASSRAKRAHFAWLPHFA